MLNIPEKKKLKLKTTKGTEHEFTLKTLVRWYCLVEAIHYIGEQCNLNKTEFDDVDLKTVPIKNYIEERYPAMLADTRKQIHKGWYKDSLKLS